jgi:predicted metal-dependent HD superfamily phosphohydrolase
LHFATPATKELEMAILWHDAVYVPGAPAGYNETMSAARLENAIVRLDLKVDFNIDRVKELIIGTSTNNYTSSDPKPRCQDLMELMDCDLSSLGYKDYDAFETLQDYVIEEFVGSLVQYNKERAANFRKMRAEFLGKIAAKEHIYQTQEGRSAFEKNARSNINKFYAKYYV